LHQTLEKKMNWLLGEADAEIELEQYQTATEPQEETATDHQSDETETEKDIPETYSQRVLRVLDEQAHSIQQPLLKKTLKQIATQANKALTEHAELIDAAEEDILRKELEISDVEKMLVYIDRRNVPLSLSEEEDPYPSSTSMRTMRLAFYAKVLEIPEIENLFDDAKFASVDMFNNLKEHLTATRKEAKLTRKTLVKMIRDLLSILDNRYKSKFSQEDADTLSENKDNILREQFDRAFQQYSKCKGGYDDAINFSFAGKKLDLDSGSSTEEDDIAYLDEAFDPVHEVSEIESFFC